MSRRIALFDVSLITGVSLLYILFEALQLPKRWSFIVIGCVLVIYSVYLALRRTDSWRDLGFRTDNIRAGLIPVGLSTVIAGICIVAWGIVCGGAVWSYKQIVLLFVLYPVWAIVQQLAFQGLLHRRLMVLVNSRTIQIAITASAFACVHAGNSILVLMTFLAGVLWSILYRMYPNLWLIGISHTVLAALAYPLVLGDAPLTRF